MTAQIYRRACQELLVQGLAELAQGDPRQASEKGWGTAAQMVKAVAEGRNWEHKSHAALHNIVSRLADETDDNDLRRLFHVANSLYTNFYENWCTDEDVRVGLEDIQRFLDKLEPLA